MTRRFLFHPLDTLFFRDGRPFNQDDEGLAAATSLFPPNPSVLTGALRAAIARNHGWSGSGSWTKEANGQALKAMLGDGPDDLGQLRCGPPLVLRKVEKGWQRLYPPPLHLLGVDTGRCWDLAFLRPGRQRLACDLGQDVPLPELTRPLPGAKPLAKHWLTDAGMTAVLDGRGPGADDIVTIHPRGEGARREGGWQGEYRIGLARDPASRTAVAGQLYAASHVRLGRDTALGLEVEGLDQGWRPEPVATLGGFQRPVAIEEDEGARDPARSLLPEPDFDGVLRYVVVLTAPALPEGEGWRKPGARLDSRLPGRIVGACVERPAMIGGWDGRDRATGKWGPRPLVPHLPPGSVWFIEASAQDLQQHGAWQPPAAIGSETSIRQGYGACLIGRWPEGGH